MGANSPKYRDYMITINKGAKCYGEALEIVKELNLKLFAYIVHDKDVETYQDENGELKQRPKTEHIHIVVELNNPVSFNSMQKKFEGAHIEQVRYKKSAYQYLIHNSPNSKEKYQYPIEAIISNSIESVKFAIETETFETFKENMWLRYMCEGTRTAYQFTKRFGLNVYKQYWKAYKDMIDMSAEDEEMQADIERMMKALQDELPF